MIWTSTKEDYFEIKFKNRNQVDDKIVWVLEWGFYLFIQVLSANTLPVKPKMWQRQDVHNFVSKLKL